MAEKDILEKTLESFNDVFSDIVNGLLFDGVERVKEDELEQATPTSYYKAEGNVRAQERDTAKYWKRLNLRIALYGMENETEPEDDMPLRIIGYDGASYRDQLFYEKGEDGKRRLNKSPRYPVVTLVLYFGIRHWDKPVTLHDCLDVPDEVLPYVNDYRINLFEIAWLSDEQVARFKSDFRIVADYFVQMRKNGDYIPSAQQMTHVREVLHMMSVLTRDDRFEKVQEHLGEGGERITMRDAFLDRWLNKEFENATKKATEKATEKTRTDTLVDSIRSLMRTMGWTVEQAMAAIEVPAAEREKYIGLVKQ